MPRWCERSVILASLIKNITGESNISGTGAISQRKTVGLRRRHSSVPASSRGQCLVGRLTLCCFLIKYADDTYLLVGFSHLNTITEEFAHISAWAKAHNLLHNLNPNKTRELLISKRGRKESTTPILI